ncbi:hypothetical protein R3F72_00085 [Salinicola sp. 4072]|uniref:hypothetical protein n=1 Tax=Salinicola sp. 4072 TaxID=3082157 RepID=UPI002FC7218C
MFDSDDAISQLPEIEKAIRAIPKRQIQERMLEDDFDPNTIRWGSQKGQVRWHLIKDSRLYQCRTFVQTLLTLDDHRYNLSLHARAFLKHFRWCLQDFGSNETWIFHESRASRISQRFDLSLKALSKEITSTAFRRKVKTADKATKDRYETLNKWMRAAFRQAPNILWVHIQLGYKTKRYEDLQQTLKDRKDFLKNREGNPLFSDLVGYVGKLHYHPMKGLVHDMIFLYDARHVQEAASLAQALSKRWDRATRHSGIAWIEGEPLHPEAPRINGIWSMKAPEDRQRRKALIHYLSHYDTYLHYDLPANTKTLVKSQTPGKKRANVRNKKR